MAQSPHYYNAVTSFVIYLMTSAVKGYAFKVLLAQSGLVSGVVLADQVRSLDWRARRARFSGRASAQLVREVKEKIEVLIGRDPLSKI